MLPSNVTSAGSMKVTDDGRSAGVKDLNKSKKPWHNGALFHFRSRPPGEAYCFQRRHRKRIAPCDPKRDRSGPYDFISVNYPTASSVTWASRQPISKVMRIKLRNESSVTLPRRDGDFKENLNLMPMRQTISKVESNEGEAASRQL